MTHRTSQVVFNLLYLGWYEDIFITMTNVVAENFWQNQVFSDKCFLWELSTLLSTNIERVVGLFFFFPVWLFFFEMVLEFSLCWNEANLFLKWETPI